MRILLHLKTPREILENITGSSDSVEGPSEITDSTNRGLSSAAASNLTVGDWLVDLSPGNAGGAIDGWSTPIAGRTPLSSSTELALQEAVLDEVGVGLAARDEVLLVCGDDKALLAAKADRETLSWGELGVDQAWVGGWLLRSTEFRFMVDLGLVAAPAEAGLEVEAKAETVGLGVQSSEAKEQAGSCGQCFLG